MADTPTPMTDADIIPAAASERLQPIDPVKAPDTSPSESKSSSESRLSAVTQAVKDNGQTLRAQATDKVLTFADDGKARAVGALDEFATMLTDAAGTVDEKLGEQYGQYARAAADKVIELKSAIDGKSVDQLVGDAREIVRKSPGVAVGVAAAVGFVVARVLTAGLDQRA